MTVQDLYDDALALSKMASEDADDYTPFVLRHVNFILADLFEIENGQRDKAGVAAITEIPTVSDLTDEIIYQDVLTRNVMPYGLIELLVLNEDNPSIGFYHQKYEDGKSKYDVFTVGSVEDYYGETEE